MAELLPLKVHLFILTLLHSEWPKLHRVLAILRAKGLSPIFMYPNAKPMCMYFSFSVGIWNFQMYGYTSKFSRKFYKDEFFL